MRSMEKIKIVIIGGDISGPISAAKLARYLPASLYDIKFINPPRLERAGFCAHIPPSIKALHRDLRIKEVDFIRASEATFSLGTDVWDDGRRSFIPFGPLGPILNDTEFHHVVHCADRADLYQLNLPASLVKQQKFLLPQPSGPLLLSGFDYGYHVNVDAYAKFLTAKAENMGCSVMCADIVKVEREAEQISAVYLDNGKAVLGDIFIDCSGVASKLDLIDSHDNWTEVPELPSFFSIEFTKLGNEPLLGACSTSFQSDLCSVTYQTQKESVSIKFSNKGERLKSGWLKEPWVGNVISMGLASFSLPPMGGWNVKLIDEQIGRLIEFMPLSGSQTPLKHEYNRLSDERLRRVVDFAVLFYRFNGIDIHDYAKIWPAAYHKYTYFKSRGGFAVMDQDDDRKDEWIAMFLSRYGWPEDKNIMAQQLDATALRQDLDGIEKAVAHIVANASSHREFIATNCAAIGFTA